MYSLSPPESPSDDSRTVASSLHPQQRPNMQPVHSTPMCNVDQQSQALVDASHPQKSTHSELNQADTTFTTSLREPVFSPNLSQTYGSSQNAPPEGDTRVELQPYGQPSATSLLERASPARQTLPGYQSCQTNFVTARTKQSDNDHRRSSSGKRFPCLLEGCPGIYCREDAMFAHFTREHIMRGILASSTRRDTKVGTTTRKDATHFDGKQQEARATALPPQRIFNDSRGRVNEVQALLDPSLDAHGYAGILLPQSSPNASTGPTGNPFDAYSPHQAFPAISCQSNMQSVQLQPGSHLSQGALRMPFFQEQPQLATGGQLTLSSAPGSRMSHGNLRQILARITSESDPRAGLIATELCAGDSGQLQTSTLEPDTINENDAISWDMY